ncbi:hypothetical protein L9F63_007576 [Diploptera punctata]|uniref:Sodium-coupled monocarboxylate transporter 2 n=1 Tax=Diploptera punctata TaxID=6984 RepID=A0AAD7Z7V5_DIPPU|nr:hypothetical protein L9F63_007576 [Diploptera punctata]
MASVLCTVGVLLYIPIVVYVPALAFSQVSGFSVHFITPAIAIICIFYTMVGGIKAVVWTDFLQGFFTLASSVAVVILGLVHVGGFGKVWERNMEGGRIRFFEMSISPLERMTFWNVIIGYSFYWGGMITVNQAMVQKFLSLPTYKNAKTALYIFVVGLMVVNTITCYIGLVMFASYHDCDPLKTQGISRPDQLLPYYVTDVGASIPGLAGLFVAGIFSSSLSTISSSLNALGATLFEDFIRPCFKNKLNDRVASNIIKLVVMIIGTICVLIVFVVHKLGTILQVTIAAASVTNGATLGLFTFGMLFPRGNAKGALAGSIVSMLIMVCIVFGNQKASADRRIKQPTLPTSVVGCGFNVTQPDKGLIIKDENEEDEVFVLFRISFMLYTLMGLIIMFIVATAVSLFTEPPNLNEMNISLFAPFMRNYVRKRKGKDCSQEATQTQLLNEFSNEDPPDKMENSHKNEKL